MARYGVGIVLITPSRMLNQSKKRYTKADVKNPSEKEPLIPDKQGTDNKSYSPDKDKKK